MRNLVTMPRFKVDFALLLGSLLLGLPQAGKVYAQTPEPASQVQKQEGFARYKPCGTPTTAKPTRNKLSGNIILVGAGGFEPPTSSASGKRSPAELRAYISDQMPEKYFLKKQLFVRA